MVHIKKKSLKKKKKNDTNPTLTAPSAGKDVEQQELSSAADGNTHWSTPWKRLSYKTKHPLTIRSKNLAAWVNLLYPNELKTCPRKNLNTNVYSSFIYNCQKLEVIKMPFSRGMNK